MKNEKKDSMRKKILTVDNDENILDSIESIFQSMDEEEYLFFSTTSGKKALELIRKYKPDLVITAIDIGDIDGIDIIKASRKQKIPSIVLSSRVDKETVDMIKCYYKPDAYLKKPLEKPQLYGAVKNLLMKKTDVIKGIPEDKMEDLLKGICNNIDQGIAIIDKDFNIVWVNDSLEKKGFLFENVVGKKSYQVFDNMDHPEPGNPSVSAFNNKHTASIIKKGNDDHRYRITSIPIKDNNGEVIYVIEYGEDLTRLEGLKKAAT